MTTRHSDIHDVLDGVHYPTTTEDLLRHVELNGATAELIAAVGALPPHTFDSPEAVVTALDRAG